jgi:hypothetical protein
LPLGQSISDLTNTLDRVDKYPFRLAERLRQVSRRFGMMTERPRQVAERLFILAKRLRPSARPTRLDFERVSFEPERLYQDRTAGCHADLAPPTLLIVKGAISFDG